MSDRDVLSACVTSLRVIARDYFTPWAMECRVVAERIERLVSATQAEQVGTGEPSDDALRAMWRNEGGGFHGPHIETGAMPESLLLPFLRRLLAPSPPRAEVAIDAALIASELARIDGYDPDDVHGGLYDLCWSSGAQPEPMGDTWNMDYLPKGERIAAALKAALGQGGE